LRWKTVNFRTVRDARGNLTPIEGGTDVAFDIARIYYLYDVPSGSHRAGHAHKVLHQIYMALSGSFDVHLDDGDIRGTVTLNRPDQGIYIGPGVWRDIDNFSAGSVCLVLASAKFDEADYIRDYESFRWYAERREPMQIDD
jgi:oxalate decarboxylase/phosphoglucose isomerase-like protein (cupin superfamily)